MKYISNCVTYCNNKWMDKPNEDYFICDDIGQIYILVDGVSRDRIGGVYPNPSPAREVSEIFVKVVYDYLKAHSQHFLIREAIEIGNNEVAKYNEKMNWENDFLPGTVGIVAMIKKEKMYYCYIGDCYGLKVSKKGKKTFFTDCQTKMIAKYGKQYTAYEIRNKICNNKAHSCAYGVLNGDMRAMDFVVAGMIEIEDGEKIFLCSDGFDDLVQNCSAADLYKMSLEEMGNKSKNMDDKTMIVIGEADK